MKREKFSVSIGASFAVSRRAMIMVGTAALLGGCAVIPKVDAPVTGPAPAPTPSPTPTELPTDATHHRVALLVPMSGSTAACAPLTSVDEPVLRR